jgi:hypothetical protein
MPHQTEYYSDPSPTRGQAKIIRFSHDARDINENHVKLTGIDPLTLIEANLPRSYIVPYFFPNGTYKDCCDLKLVTYRSFHRWLLK